MATIKSYSDLQQSRKLAKILPIESADMKILPFTEREYRIVPINDIAVCGREDEICAWSLAALLSVIPNYKLSSEHNHHTCTAETSFGKETVAWFDNPVDACYEMIINLKEKNLL